MARSPISKPTQTNFDPGHNSQQDVRSALELPPRASRSQFDNTPIEANRESEYEDKNLPRAWKQFQADWELREERWWSNPRLSTRSHEGGHTATSNLDEAKNRFSHSILSRARKDADFVNISDASWSMVATLSHNRQLYQHHITSPPSSSPSSNRRIKQRGYSQGAYEENRESVHRPSPPSLTSGTERFAQDRSDWSSASIPPRDYSNTPTYHPYTGSPPDPSGHKLRGLTRRPRVQKPHKRVSRLQGDMSNKSVDLEAPRATEMDYSVMSVRRTNPDGSGSSFSSRFALPPGTTGPIPIRGSYCGARRLSTSPSSHVDSETERPRSRIKAREEAGSASINIYSIPKEEPHALVIPSLMDCMEEQSSSSSPISTPKAPPLDQHSMIREDLQREDERPIAKCRADLQISFRETAAVEDCKSLGFVHSTSSLDVSHLQSYEVPGKKGDGRKQKALFQEVYQMLDPPTHPGSDALRSKMEIRRDENSREGITRPDCALEEESSPDTPRGPQGPEQTLHVDVLLAQRVARDAMWEEGEGVGFADQPCMLSASECGEEASDSNSNWSECGLDRKRSTRSVFDWGYA